MNEAEDAGQRSEEVPGHVDGKNQDVILNSGPDDGGEKPEITKFACHLPFILKIFLHQKATTRVKPTSLFYFSFKG